MTAHVRRVSHAYEDSQGTPAVTGGGTRKAHLIRNASYSTLTYMYLIGMCAGFRKQLAAVFTIGGKDFDRKENMDIMFSATVFYLLLKPNPRLKDSRAVNRLVLDGLLIDIARVKHVAFYAWSPMDISTALATLAWKCPHLETVTIGFTHIDGLAPWQYENLLWCGWDSMDSGDGIRTLTPDLEAFAKSFRNGLDEMRTLGADVLPETEENMFATRNLEDHDHRLPALERYFKGRKVPVIRVVDVPLLNSGSAEEIERAWIEGMSPPESDSEDDRDQEKVNQSPLRSKVMNLPENRTDSKLRKISRLNPPSRHSSLTSSICGSDEIIGDENHNPNETSREDMPVRASIHPSSHHHGAMAKQQYTHPDCYAHTPIHNSNCLAAGLKPTPFTRMTTALSGIPPISPNIPIATLADRTAQHDN